METGQAYDRLGLHGDLIPGAILHAGAMLLGMEWTQIPQSPCFPRKERVFLGSPDFWNHATLICMFFFPAGIMICLRISM